MCLVLMRRGATGSVWLALADLALVGLALAGLALAGVALARVDSPRTG
jgi:hypothetical protein